MISPHCQALVHPLSARELEVLRHAQLGMSNKEIGRALCISRRTVANHMTSVLQKLGVNDRTAAVVAMMRAGALQ